MAFCSGCGTQIADGTTMCPACSAKASAGGTAQAGTGGMADNVAGMLAYVTVIPAIIFLVMEPYNKNRFVRFHSFQCIFLAVACIVVQIVLSVIPIIGWILIPFFGLAVLVLFVILLLKAYQGQKFKLPVIGDMAEKQANAV